MNAWLQELQEKHAHVSDAGKLKTIVIGDRWQSLGNNNWLFIRSVVASMGCQEWGSWQSLCSRQGGSTKTGSQTDTWWAPYHAGPFDTNIAPAAEENVVTHRDESVHAS